MAVGYPPLAAPAQAAATSAVAIWELNDSLGSSAMADSSGNGLDGQIGADAAAAGLTLNGSYYTWAARCPICLPVQEARVVQVPDDDRLDIPDPTATYTLEFSFRTTHPYGNFMQKGQSTSMGGQIKVQGPGGIVQCLFKGADGTRVGTGSPTALDDGLWHVVQCVHTETQVKEFVDGVRVAVKNGSTGPINNKQPFTIGGKHNCDQVAITCDYFSGDIDYVKVWTDGASSNQFPMAAFTSTCVNNSCSFDSSTSSDPDGTIASYAWSFGDGATTNVANPTHVYAGSGDYDVTLTVTDNGGAKDNMVNGVSILAVPPGAPRNAAAESADSAANVSWDVPADSGSDPITQYVVTSTPDGKTCSTPDLTCDVTDLVNGRSYTFAVVATSAAASSAPSSPTNSVVPAGSPGRVQRPTTHAAKRAARITWTAANANGAEVKSYRIVTSRGQHRVVRGTVLTLRFDHLRRGVSYRFRVRATNRVGSGAWSPWSRSVTVR